jgi:AcrR family transcriptional regulator
MNTNLRTYRTILQNAGRPAPELTMRQRETRERILTYAQTLMAAVGTLTLKFSTLAAAIYVAPATLRRHFADLDALLTTLIVRHLDTILAAITEIPNTDPDRDAKRRAAYLAATRTPSGALTEAHLLLVRDSHALPQDELTNIEAYRHQIGILLAGDHAHLIFPILDNPRATHEEIEFLVANLRAIPTPHHAPRPQITPPRPQPPAEPDLAPFDPFIRPPSVFDALLPDHLQVHARPPARPP